MDRKSKEIYNKIENFLEERKGRERRNEEPAPQAVVKPASTSSERRKSRDRRSNAE